MKIEITKASNGFIKTVFDENFNGSGLSIKETKLFQIERNGIGTAKLLNEICADLGLSQYKVYIEDEPKQIQKNTQTTKRKGLLNLDALLKFQDGQ